jgi:hypothetical protein
MLLEDDWHRLRPVLDHFFFRVGTYVNSGVFGGIRGGQKKVVQNRSDSVSIMLDDAP